MQRYVRALEQERTKILFFQRELPLSLQLVTRAIESCKQQLSDPAMECDSQNEQSEKVLEEFVSIPAIVKRASSNSEEFYSKKPRIDGKDGKNDDDNGKKSDWLRSVQLWNQPSKEDDSGKKVGVKRDGCGGAFHPFKKEKSAEIVPPASAGGTVNTKEENEGPSRKSRRCWSPQLHKRFLQALHELGGSHVATPKQIRDLMNVEGLTNDEVKSHLQKYRLHTRRPVPSSQNTTVTTAQAPQIVVVTGGLWVPPEYSVAVAASTTSREAPNGIFAPMASLPPPFQETSATSTQHQRSNETSDYNIRGSRSPVTSSSVHTSTAPLAC